MSISKNFFQIFFLDFLYKYYPRCVELKDTQLCLYIHFIRGLNVKYTSNALIFSSDFLLIVVNFSE